MKYISKKFFRIAVGIVSLGQVSFLGAMVALDSCTSIILFNDMSYSYSSSSSISSSSPNNASLSGLTFPSCSDQSKQFNRFLKKMSVDESYEATALIQFKCKGGISFQTLYFYPESLNDDVELIDRYEHFDSETTAKINCAILTYALNKYQDEPQQPNLSNLTSAPFLKPNKIFY